MYYNFYYSIPFRSCIYQSDVKECESNGKTDKPLEPCPRFAHQLVYDHIRKVSKNGFSELIKSFQTAT